MCGIAGPTAFQRICLSLMSLDGGSRQEERKCRKDRKKVNGLEEEFPKCTLDKVTSWENMNASWSPESEVVDTLGEEAFWQTTH